MSKLYNVKLSNIYIFETQVAADNFDEACDKADNIDWDYLISAGDDTEVSTEGFDVEEVEDAQ